MKTALGLVLAFALANSASAQGFMNLDFEGADVTSAVYVPIYGGWTVNASAAFPAWNTTIVYPSTPAQTVGTVFYNTYILDSSHMGVFDSGAATNFPGSRLGSPIAGNFSAYLHADEGSPLPDTDGAPSLSQTGLIPATANSLWFATSPADSAPEINPPDHYDLLVFIDGMPVAYTMMETHSDYILWAADISSFAGTTAELRFSLDSYLGGGLPNDRGVMIALDDISFSPVVVPEPTPFALMSILAVAMLCLTLLKTVGAESRTSRCTE